MNYDDIFQEYYTLYRAEAEIPGDTDDEYVIGIPLANEAIRRWENYDNTFWDQLFTTAQQDGGGELVTTATDLSYAAPSSMRAAAGSIRLSNSNGTIARIPIVKAYRQQFLSNAANFAYFTGNPNTGFTLNFNVLPTDQFVGATIDYVFYKKAALITDGDSNPDMANPMFIVHRMLANRFRASRNPYYNSAKQDAEDALGVMKMENMSGNWADPFKLPDNSGSTWGW